jgi:hypothetical protein
MATAANVEDKRDGSTLGGSDTAPVVSDKEAVADAEAGLSGSAPSAPAAFTVPDGGLEAWLVVVGGWLVLFSTFGYVNGVWPKSFPSLTALNSRPAFGVYQAYYIGALNRSASDISWIGSFQLWLQFTMGMFTGKYFDEGYGRLLLLGGSIVYTLSYVCSVSRSQSNTELFLDSS